MHESIDEEKEEKDYSELQFMEKAVQITSFE